MSTCVQLQMRTIITSGNKYPYIIKHGPQGLIIQSIHQKRGSTPA